MGDVEAGRLTQAITRYSTARAEFLRELGVAGSNRDPLAEFSEYFAVSLLGGRLADSRVQKGYDLIDAQGRYVQVRYLANAAERWVNEHLVIFDEGLDAYALLIFENLAPTGMVVFPRAAVSAVGAALGKRHPNQDRTLQLTQANWLALLARQAEFVALGLAFFLAPAWRLNQAQ